MSFPGGSNGQFKMRLLRDDELVRLLEAADHYGQRWNGGGQGWLVRRPDHRFRWPSLMLLLIAYGPRIREALLLKWADVDFDRKTITFQTLKKFKKDANGVRHRVPTTRTLPLLEEVAARLLAYREVAPKDMAVFPTTSLKSGCTVAWRAMQRMLKPTWGRQDRTSRPFAATFQVRGTLPPSSEPP